MQELIERLSSVIGVDASTAQNVIGIVLNLIKSKAQDEEFASLLSAFPGAQGILDNISDASNSSSGIGGLLSGAIGQLTGEQDLMDAFTKLQAEGLDIDQAKTAGREILNFAREKVGDDVVKSIADTIPGLSQLL